MSEEQSRYHGDGVVNKEPPVKGKEEDPSEIPEFTEQETRFIYEYFKSFNGHIPPEGLVTQGMLSIIALPLRGNTHTFSFTNLEIGQSLVLKLDSSEIDNFLTLPDREQLIFINPILRREKEGRLFGSRLMKGMEGDEIRMGLAMEMFVFKARDIILSAANASVRFTDIDIFTGKNLFFDLTDVENLEEGIFKIFDHGSYRFSPEMNSDEIIREILLSEIDTLLSPFYAVSGDPFMLVSSPEGETRISEEFTQAVSFIFNLIRSVCKAKDWETFPFYQLKFVPTNLASRPIRAPRTEKNIVNIPVMANEVDFIKLICETVLDYKGKRDQVVVKEEGKEVVGEITMTRAQAVEMLRREYNF